MQENRTSSDNRWVFWGGLNVSGNATMPECNILRALPRRLMSVNDRKGREWVANIDHLLGSGDRMMAFLLNDDASNSDEDPFQRHRNQQKAEPNLLQHGFGNRVTSTGRPKSVVGRQRPAETTQDPHTVWQSANALTDMLIYWSTNCAQWGVVAI